MATTHGTATHLSAGPMAISAPLAGDDVEEFQKILNIKDQIFSGTHPRLTVPPHLVRKSGPANGKHVSAQAQQPQPTNPKAKAALDTPPVRDTTKTAFQNTDSTLNTNASSAPKPARMAPKPTSEINPIFLTKSDDLVRAEQQLQRQRLERALRDQVELQKKETRQRPAVQDTKPDFDVSEVFKQALDVVKPVSLSDPSESSGPGDDSFDDNSFYSSRAPDSPPVPQRKPSPAAVVPPTGPAVRAPVAYGDELQRLEALNPGSDLELQDAYLVADQRPSYSQKQASHQNAEASASRLRESQRMETEDEPDYSPPAPAAPPIEHHDYSRGIGGAAGRQPRENIRYAEKPQDPREPTSPAHVKVVRNHITSPAAPRPSRVSPLAMAKAPSVQQIRAERPEIGTVQLYSDPDSARASPSAPVPNVVSRKRRRLREGDDGIRQAPHRRPNVEPAETFIKEEPVSPPPFADDPSAIRSRHPQERPVYIDIASPQYAPAYESRGPPMREAVYEVDPYHEIAPEAGPQRTMSRLSVRRPIREDVDLRRVASVQYARQPDYSREYIEAQPRPIRAASHVVERPVQERVRYYEEAPSYPQHRYVPVDDMPPPSYREPYYEEAPPARIMAPPQRRIVVDEHGNQYYELLQAPRLQPMAPPPPPRPVSQMSKDVYEERLPQHHSASVRAPSVVQEPYSERRYVQEMPPPQPIYRRVTSDYARPAPVPERQSYAAPYDGYEPYARSASVQVAEYLPPRHTVYVDERGVPQERVVRTASVRPPQPRYEEPHEVQRVGSVRPMAPAREPSVFMEERPMGEYIERPYYIRERRYYPGEGEETDRIAYDGATDPAQRAPQRYQ
ncbi:unnamed protein product [Penicillium salamii]|uniref:Uncharacterized protein n=1 Tax=Penicillium salamii TaxID=1612424 RepID=A0A9W4NIH2_9EURO|nr:unnamed protein product [Penicillium salamii]CAG8125779.1 unnamed protein product [Penicillium salamii]CAG8223737.1 unnamed protein product [Penicillium salamii]CAG8305057.1 unnamed protein product [Penicillium salamii]CAG8327129.1 unnamed protein product [Penicillium salamii]